MCVCVLARVSPTPGLAIVSRPGVASSTRCCCRRHHHRRSHASPDGQCSGNEQCRLAHIGGPELAQSVAQAICHHPTCETGFCLLVLADRPTGGILCGRPGTVFAHPIVCIALFFFFFFKNVVSGDFFPFIRCNVFFLFFFFAVFTFYV